LISDDFILKPLISYEGAIEQIAVLNFDGKFLVIVDGKMKIISNSSEASLLFDELAGELNVLSQRALLKKSGEAVLIECKAAEGK